MPADGGSGDRVLLADPIHSRARDWLDERCEVIELARVSADRLEEAARHCDGLIVRTTPIPAALLRAGDRLRVVAKHGTGTDNIDVSAASERGIVVANCPGENAPAVAEFALACVLLVLRPIVAAAEWLRSAPPGRSLVAASEEAGLVGSELSAQTVGVVGWGRIGRRLGLACRALGAKVIAFDPGVLPAVIRADGVEVAAGLDELLEAADVLSLHVPLTASTRGLIGARELALMPRGAALVNVSRGGVVDEAALADALKRGHLRSAAVDVFAEEPPPADHPLLGLPNALCTPHLGAATGEALARMGMCAANAVLDVLDGRWPRHPVNPEVVPRSPLVPGGST